MASVQDYKRRIRSVRNTRKITRAMELVAAAKLRRAQSRIEAMRPYAETMRELISGVGRAAGSVRGLPLLQQRETTSATLLVPLTGDRGLAGAFNAQVMRRAFALDRQLTAEGQTVRWLGVGKKGRSTLTFRRRELSGSFVGFTDAPAYSDAQGIAHRAAELFVEGEVDRVVLVYNTFVSALTQSVTEQEILPIAADVLETDEDERRDDALRGDFIFEPEPEQILERLLPVYVETQIYRALLESSASEQGARMTAMRNASKNAAEMIDSLSLEMNRARQAEITQEILEVVAGADALDLATRSGIPQERNPAADPRLRRGTSLKAPAVAVATAGIRSARNSVRCHGRNCRNPRPPATKTDRRRPISSDPALFSTRSRDDHQHHIRRAPRPYRRRRGGGAPVHGEIRARGYWEQVWRRFKRDRVAMASIGFLVLLIIAVYPGAWIAEKLLGHGPNDIFPSALDDGLLPVGPMSRVENFETGGPTSSSSAPTGRSGATSSSGSSTAAASRCRWRSSRRSS